jgi:hypothetical protein
MQFHASPKRLPTSSFFSAQSLFFFIVLLRLLASFDAASFASEFFRRAVSFSVTQLA